LVDRWQLGHENVAGLAKGSDTGVGGRDEHSPKICKIAESDNGSSLGAAIVTGFLHFGHGIVRPAKVLAALIWCPDSQTTCRYDIFDSLQTRSILVFIFGVRNQKLAHIRRQVLPDLIDSLSKDGLFQVRIPHAQPRLQKPKVHKKPVRRWQAPHQPT
jgi:hypothetical protein